MPRAGLALLLAALCAHGAADTAWITSDDYGSLRVVIADDASEPERVTARRFATRWKTLTGFEPGISSEGAPDGVNVWIGSAWSGAHPGHADDSQMSSDGFRIRAFRDETGAHLILEGGGPRGTLYAEWEFFERYLGAKSFGPEGFVWPEPPPAIVPRIDFRYEPSFRYRDTNFSAYLERSWLANLNRLNGQWTALPGDLGGHIGFVHELEGFGHTFHDFVSPEEYFDAHPEYFAEIDGEREKWSQLCLTNPDVLAITIARAREFLRGAAEDERILSVSQEDYPAFASWCTCADCAAVDREEGSHSGTVIRFVNAVAEAVEDEFPDALIDTFAYMHTRRPPKVTRPRSNVLVRVCAIEADYGRPLRDRRSERNREFLRDLRGWRRIGGQVWVWDYTQNWWAFAAPHPNEHVLQPNLATYRRIGVDGVFEQASPFASNSDLEALKSYLVGRGLRDSGFHSRRACDEFLAYYYGPAAPYIDEYRRVLHDRLRASGAALRFYNDLSWLNATTVERAETIFERVRTDAIAEPYAGRVREAYVAVQFAALVCPPRVYQTPDAYVFTRPASQTIDEYLAMMRSRGVEFLNDYPLDALREQLPEGTPPRHEVAPIERLVNDRFEIWVVPARSGAVVRWRDRSTGRDWLGGFDAIEDDTGRIQDWADTSPFPTAKPRPVERRYVVAGRSENSITVAATLDNGLRVTRRMTLTNDGLDVAVELANDGSEPVVPKFGVGADFSEPELSRPALWVETEGAWRREAWSRDDDADVLRWKSTSGERAWALRYSGAARTVATRALDGATSRAWVARRPGGDSTAITLTMERAPLSPGERRSMTVRFSISGAVPSRVPAVSSL